MNRADFIFILDKSLIQLPKEERENALRYYEDFFDDAESEEKALESLGDPRKIAEQILIENGIQPDFSSEIKPAPAAEKAAKPKHTSSNAIPALIIIVLTFPLWIGIVGALFGIFVAVIAVSASLVFASAVAGVACFGAGIYMLFEFPPAGLVLMGVGLVFIGILILFCVPLVKLCWKFIVWLVNTAVNFLSKLFNRKEASV